MPFGYISSTNQIYDHVQTGIVSPAQLIPLLSSLFHKLNNKHMLLSNLAAFFCVFLLQKTNDYHAPAWPAINLYSFQSKVALCVEKFIKGTNVLNKGGHQKKHKQYYVE
jgi:hypothetical protein